MSTMKVTANGLLAISNANVGGFKISIDSFRLTNYLYGDTTDVDAQAQALRGATLYSGSILSVERLDNSSVKYECVVPVDQPSAGQYTFGEIGLYLDSGELFALGKLDPPLIKQTNLSLTIYAVVSAARLGGVINVTVSDHYNLATTVVDRLTVPQDAKTNILAAADANQASAGLVVKQGQHEWNFLGYDKVSTTRVTPITRSSFSLDPNLAGFWLNDGEKLIVQVLNGPGQGQSRIVQYFSKILTVEHAFEAELPFPSLTSDSLLAFWRNHSQVYPDRRGVPSSHVLYAGEDTISASWDTASPIPGQLKVHSLYWTALANQYQFQIPDGTPKSYQDRNNLLLFIDGVLAPFSDFSVYTRTLVTQPLPASTKVSLYIFYRVTDQGASFKLYDELIELAKLQTYQGKPSYDLPIVPASVEDSLGFTFSSNTGLGTEIPHDWTFTGQRITFNASPNADTLILVWGYEEISGGYSIPRQYEWLHSRRYFDSATNSYSFPLVDSPNSQSYVLFINGRIVHRNRYHVDGASIKIHKSDLALADGDCLRFVWILNKFGSKTEPEAPAFVPNCLVQSCTAYETPAASYRIKVPPINDHHVLVFVEGLKQERGADWILRGVDVVEFVHPLDDGKSVDIISYSQTSSTGHQLSSAGYSFTLSNRLDYSIPLPVPDTADSLLLFVEGLYIHQSEYQFSGDSSSFTVKFNLQPVPESKAEILVFATVACPNARTDLIQCYPSPHIGFKRFYTESKTVIQANSLLFVGPIYQHRSSYQIRGPEVVLNQFIPYEQHDPTNYSLLQVEFFGFDSGIGLAAINRDLLQLSALSKPARNTGPYWADPAGINKGPNKMDVSVACFTSGPATIYTFVPPYQSSAIFVFIHGAMQYNGIDYVFTNLNQIRFTSEIPSGHPVDIFTFQCKEDDVGYELDIKVFETVSNQTNSYLIAYPLDRAEHLMVFVEGIYFHRLWYSISRVGSGFNLSFKNGLLNNLRIEVCIWHQFLSDNAYTELLLQLPNPAVGAKSIVLREEAKKQNTFVFVGPLYQSKQTYLVDTMTLHLETSINYEYLDPLNYKDMPITICSFRTGKSKTRLITRDELRDNYLTRHGGDLKGPLYTKDDPESELEVANKRYVDAIKVELEEMRQLLSKLQGQAEDLTYRPLLSISPNLIRLGDPVLIKLVNASPGKRVELEVRGSSGVYNERSVKGITKLDGTFTLGPVGIDSGFTDYLTVTAWVDGFRVANTVDVKITDTMTQSGPAMVSKDRDVYSLYDYVTLSIADAIPGGRVTWGVNGASPSSVPVGQPSFIGVDGTWSMQIPAGGMPTNYIVELFVDNASVGTLGIVVSSSRDEKLPSVVFNATEIYRDEILDVKIQDGQPYGPVSFSAKAVGAGRSGPTDSAGLLNTDGSLNFGFRFTSAGDYIIYITVNRNLFTHKLAVKKVSPNDPLIVEQMDGYRAYIKQY